MVCDAKGNLDRFHRVIRMELPNNGRLRFRCARQILGASATQHPTLRRSGVVTGLLPLNSFDPIVFIKGQNLLGSHRGLVP
jgi:hypothetical protein